MKLNNIRRITTPILGASAGLICFCMAALAAVLPGQTDFSGVGFANNGGAITCPAGLCPESDTSTCTNTGGSGKVSMLGTVVFSTILAVDNSETLGTCNQSFAQVLLIPTASPREKLALDFIGTACPAGSEQLFYGGYLVNDQNSSGKYATSSGSGTLSDGLGTGTTFVWSVNGTLVVTP